MSETENWYFPDEFDDDLNVFRALQSLPASDLNIIFH